MSDQQPPTDVDRRPEIPLRDAAVHVVRVLREAGREAYFAGGCVRDRLMSHEPTDYDVATDATAEDIHRLFRRAHSVGESFGVVRVRHSGHIIEVATFRTDGVYSDGRRPDSVEQTDAKHDAMRRDFTINGLFEDPLTDRIIDYVGGRADLESKVIRAIGEPDDRLQEDNLRMLRAVRFAARFGFAVEPATADAIRRRAGELVGVSRERIGIEIKKMLCDHNRGVAAGELQYLSLDEAVLGEPSLKVAPTRLGNLPPAVEYATALTAWLLDRHPEATDDGEHGRIAERWAERLMLSNAEASGLRACLAVHRSLASDWPRLGIAGQKRLASSPAFGPAVDILATTDRNRFIAIRKRVSELKESGLAPPPLIDGADLIAIGLTPGPPFKWVLDRVYDAQLEGAIQTAEEALRLAKALAASGQHEE